MTFVCLNRHGVSGTVVREGRGLLKLWKHYDFMIMYQTSRFLKKTGTPIPLPGLHGIKHR